MIDQLVTPTTGLLRRNQTPAWVIAGLVAMLGGTTALLRVRHLLAWSFDLGFYIQDLFAIRTGQWANTIMGFGVFSDHVSPILVPLAFVTPARWPGEFLVVVQAIAIAITVVPLMKLGHLIAGEKGAMIAGVGYGASSAVWHALMYDFHPVTLALPIAAWLLLEIERGSSGRPWWPLLATVLVREDIALLYGLVVLVAALLQKRRAWLWAGASAMVVGLGYFLLMRSQPGIGDHFWYRYGGDVSDLLTRPLRANALVSLGAVMIPLLVIAPFRSIRRSWPGLLLLASFVFASYEQQASLYYQYFAQSIPFLIAGSIAFIAGGGQRTIRLSVIATALTFVLLGPVIYIGFGLPDRFISTVASTPERARIREMLAMIPRTASVSATEMIVPALAWRSEIHPFPGPMVCGNSLGYYTPETDAVDYVVLEPMNAPLGPDWQAVLPEWGYVEVVESEGVELWKLASTGWAGEQCPPWVEQKAALIDR